MTTDTATENDPALEAEEDLTFRLGYQLPLIDSPSYVFWSFVLILIGLLSFVVGYACLLGGRANEGVIWILGAFSCCTGGLDFLVKRIRGLARRSQIANSQGHIDPLNQGCIAWNPEGVDDDARFLHRRVYRIAILVGAFLVYANYAVFWVGNNWFYSAAILAGDLIAICYAATWGKILIRWWLYGASRLRFVSFPYFLGQSFDALLDVGSEIRGPGEIRFQLRCIEEVRIKGWAEKYLLIPTIVQCIDSKQLWSASYRMSYDKSIRPGDSIAVHFDLPMDDLLQTQIAEYPSIVWELVVTIKNSILGYKSTFLVPVIAR